MSSRTSLRWILRSAVITALGALSMGCGGGIDAGEYVIYRIAFEEGDQSGDCAIGNPDTDFDSSSFRASSTLIMYAGLDDKYYLDADGAPTLEGTYESDVYTFEGETTDIQFTGPDGTGDKLTSVDSLDIEITIDGESVSGKSTSQQRNRCDNTCLNYVPYSCTIESDFVGTQIEEITLEYGL